MNIKCRLGRHNWEPTPNDNLGEEYCTRCGKTRYVIYIIVEREEEE